MGFCFAVSFYFSCNNKVSICNSVNYRYRVVVATAKVQIFKQITTAQICDNNQFRCCCYRKGTNFQANHNHALSGQSRCRVVVATAKVQIFKQITTIWRTTAMRWTLLLLPQRYKFSSKSQRRLVDIAQEWGCCCYRKGTNFQANHNGTGYLILPLLLLLLPQRYKSSSKSQLQDKCDCMGAGCCCYRKGTNFQANHNRKEKISPFM